MYHVRLYLGPAVRCAFASYFELYPQILSFTNAIRQLFEFILDLLMQKFKDGKDVGLEILLCFKVVVRHALLMSYPSSPSDT